MSHWLPLKRGSRIVQGMQNLWSIFMVAKFISATKWVAAASARGGGGASGPLPGYDYLSYFKYNNSSNDSNHNNSYANQSNKRQGNNASQHKFYLFYKRTLREHLTRCPDTDTHTVKEVFESPRLFWLKQATNSQFDGRQHCCLMLRMPTEQSQRCSNGFLADLRDSFWLRLRQRYEWALAKPSSMAGAVHDIYARTVFATSCQGFESNFALKKKQHQQQ